MGDALLVLFTAIAAAATVYYAIYSKRLWQTPQASVELTRASIELTRDSIKLSKSSVEISRVLRL